jgi:hypothetical protein
MASSRLGSNVSMLHAQTLARLAGTGVALSSGVAPPQMGDALAPREGVEWLGSMYSKKKSDKPRWHLWKEIIYFLCGFERRVEITLKIG